MRCDHSWSRRCAVDQMTLELYDFTEPFPLALRCRSGVYGLMSLESETFYVGSASDLYKRFYRHRSELRSGRHRNKHLQRSFRRHGDAAFCAVVLAFTRRSKLIHVEEGLIKSVLHLSGCCNSVTSAVRRPGDTFTPETRELCRRASSRYWANPENRRRASRMRIGRKQSPQAIALTSSAHMLPFDLVDPLGNRHTGINRAAFCRERGFKAPSLHALLHGTRKTLFGWTTPVVK